MSSKTPKHIRERREKTKKIKESKIFHERTNNWLARLSVGWKLFGGLVAALGAFATLLSLYPRFSVNAQALSDLNDPFSAPFVITNDGFLPLYNIEYAIHVTKLIDANQRGLNAPNGMFIMADKYPKWKILYGGDTATIIPHHINSPDLQFSLPLRQGELEVLVNYRYGIWPIHNQRHFSFTAVTSTGQTTWVREPRTD